MSNDNREYPAWLDEELFSGLTEEDPSAAPQSAPEEKAAETQKAAPKKKNKAKPAAPAEDDGGAKKPRAKKSAAESEDEAKPKKKKAAAKKPADEEKEAPAEGEKPEKAEKKAPVEKAESKKKPRKSAEELAAEEAERERVRKEKREKASKAARKWLIAMIVIVSLALIVCVGGIVAAYLVTNSDTNLPNVYVGGVYVGGMTKEQAIAALDEAKWDETRGGTLKVALPEGVSFEVDYLTAGAYEPKEEAAAAAYAYGHTEDYMGNLMTYIQDLLSPQELGRTEFTIDRAYVSAAVDKAVDEFESVTAGEEYQINEEASTLECVKGAGPARCECPTSPPSPRSSSASPSTPITIRKRMRSFPRSWASSSTRPRRRSSGRRPACWRNSASRSRSSSRRSRPRACRTCSSATSWATA